MNYSLRQAVLEDLLAILPWVNTPESLKMWGGAKLTFPPLAERIWLEIGAEDGNTFSLIDSNSHLVGFGQLLCREAGRLHLGRILISPEQRGQGIGHILCRQLIEFGCSEFTLNVYQDNLAALGLYTSLGFQVLAEDHEQRSYKMLLILTST